MASEAEVEYKSEFVMDEPVMFRRGKDMSYMAPGPGEQRIIMEGDLMFARNREFGLQQNAEQVFRTNLISYLSKVYRDMSSAIQQSIVEQAVKVDNYRNLYNGMLAAAIYWRSLTQITDKARLTQQALDSQATQIVLEPFITNKLEAKKIKQKNMASDDYINHLKADLVRYLRFILR